VVELGCGLGVPSLVAARGGASVLSTDERPEALELLDRNARENRLALETARVDWNAPAAVVSRGPFDLVLAADVLYERANVAPLLSLIEGLGSDAWIADPGRPATAAFLEGVRGGWSIVTHERDGMQIHRLAPGPRSVYG